MIHYDPASCSFCPRNCRADRAGGKTGYCQETGVIRVGRAALHYWEEPCISGTSGSGTVFFAGCALRCVYCQNHDLIRSGAGFPVSAQRLQEIFFELKEKGAANINLVTPDHFIPQILPSVRTAQTAGLGLPFVWNLSGYEPPGQIRALEGAADIYLADYKYADSRLAERYSRAPDYPETAMTALAEMVRQKPEPRFDPNGMMQEGVIVRHLLLPSHVNASKEALRQLYATFGNHIYISILNQYTPRPGIGAFFPELARHVTKREYERLIDYALSLGIEQAFIQEGAAASESFIPAFDGEGVRERYGYEQSPEYPEDFSESKKV